jgi:hypothetical protein
VGAARRRSIIGELRTAGIGRQFQSFDAIARTIVNL